MNKYNIKNTNQVSIATCQSVIKIYSNFIENMEEDKVILSVSNLTVPFDTPDPFIFCVYHNDKFPAGNERMEAPRKGNGSDFSGKDGYSMYHGVKIPGFPQHPHRGFETITCAMKGIVDHADSLGNAGRYGNGDLQWMTAGRGVVHGEMFPLIHQDKPNTLKLYQIWLNLPKKRKMTEPDFKMHWAEDIPKVISEISDLPSNTINYKINIWAGEFDGKKALEPPSNSWAADPQNFVLILGIELYSHKGEDVVIPGVEISFGRSRDSPTKNEINRVLYYVDGPSGIVINGTNVFNNKCAIKLDATKEVRISKFKESKNNESNDSKSIEPVICLLLQGRPINEKIIKHGPFVMNSSEEIQDAFQNYQETKFGGWPWAENGVVFPRDKGRFARIGGIECKERQIL